MNDIAPPYRIYVNQSLRLKNLLHQNRVDTSHGATRAD